MLQPTCSHTDGSSMVEAKLTEVRKNLFLNRLSFWDHSEASYRTEHDPSLTSSSVYVTSFAFSVLHPFFFFRNKAMVSSRGITVMQVESSWNVMTHCDARKGKWRGNWRIEWVTSTLHTTPGHGVSSSTTADAHTSAASGRLNWRPCRFKQTRPFRRKTKSGFCACAITLQTQSTSFAFSVLHPFF